MKEKMNQPNLAARHSLLWNAIFLWHRSGFHLPQAGKIIHTSTSITIISKYDSGIEKQSCSTHQWRYPIFVVYNGSGNLRAKFCALVMRFNKMHCYVV